MIIYWEIITLIVGFFLGALLYSFYKFRSGGIITIPLLAIYTIKFPVMLPFLLFASFISFISLQLIFTKFIIYGRRLLYISLIIGMVLTMISINLVNADAGWFALLLPGIMGYNSHREKHETKKHFFLSATSNTIYFVLILSVAFAAIYLI